MIWRAGPEGHGLPPGVTEAALSPEAAPAAVAAGGEEAGVGTALTVDGLVIPAGVYCRLRCDERQRLVRQRLARLRLPNAGASAEDSAEGGVAEPEVVRRGPHTVAYAYASGRALVRLTSAARRALRRVGRAAGEPGDRVAP